MEVYKMKYKLIAMDFDGTLVNDEKRVTPITRKILYKKKNENYKIIGVTARALESVKEIGDIDFFDYLILNNGAYIYNIKEKVGNYVKSITKEQAKEITQELEKDSIQIDYCSGTKYYIYKNKNQNKNNPAFIKNINSLDEVSEEIAKMNIFIKDQKKLDYYKNEIKRKFKDVFCFIMQDSNEEKKWLVLTPFGLNKKVTLQELGNKLKISLEEMIFFGDGLNDLEVMTAVGCSVAMENALKEVKESATAITKSNNEDGIAHFLEKL